MTARVAIGRIDGVVSSAGVILDGLPFLCRGTVEANAGLQWATKDVKRQVAVELTYLVAYLKSAGVVVENEQALDEWKQALGWK